jgi:hypothetical protein
VIGIVNCVASSLRFSAAGRFFRASIAFPLILALSYPSGPLFAQNSVSGSLKGFVKSVADGSPVPKAVIEVRNKATGARWSTVTFKDGSYTLPLLSSGEYTIYCRHPGYETESYSPVYISLVRTTVVRIPPFLLQPIARPKDARFEIGPLLVPPRASLDYRVPEAFLFMRGGPRTPGEDASPGDSPSPAPQSNPSGTPPQGASPQGSGDAGQLVNTESALRSGSFDERYLSSLPLPGIRSFDVLAFLIAGVSEPPEALNESQGPGVGAGIGTPGQFSVNGMRARSNSFSIDGSDNNDQDVAVRRQGFLSPLPQPVDSVQEFQMSTLLWDAEMGRNLGAQVNAVSRSGSNRLGGQAYGFFTDSRMNARNFFDLSGGASGGKDPLTRTQAGLTLGGPVVRDRTQVFGSFEFQGINAAREQHYASPTSRERRFLGLPAFRVVTASNSVNNDFDYETAAGATPLGLSLLSLYPLPNIPNGPYGENTYSEIQRAGGRGDVAEVKLSHQLTARQVANVRYSFLNDRRNLPGTGKAIHSAIRGDTRVQNLSVIVDSTLSSTLFNQSRVSYGRTRLNFAEVPGSPLSLAREGRTLTGQITAYTKDGDPTPLELIASSSTGPLGELIVRPYSPVGLSVSLFPQGRVNNTFQFADTVLKTRQGQTFRFGGDVRFVQFNSRQDRNYRTLVEVNNGILETRTSGGAQASTPRLLPGIQFADIGQVSSILQTMTQGDPNSYIGLRFGEYNFFANESWRVRPNLNVELGLRYEYNSVPREANRRLETAIRLEGIPAAGGSRFDSPQSTAAFEKALSAYRAILGGRDRIYDSDRNNFSPHAGFAWDPRSDGKTSVRGGYGVYYDTILGFVVSQSRNVFPYEIPFLSESSFFGHDGINANNPSFFGIGNASGDFLPFMVPGSIRLAGGSGDFVALVGTLLEATSGAGGLSFTIPDRRLRTPYVQQWHLTLERELFRQYSIAAGYVGTKGTRLTRMTAPNGGSSMTPSQVLTYREGAVPSVSFDTAQEGIVNQLPVRRSIGELGAYQIFENSAASAYHALQLELRRRYSRGVTLTGAYTFSHAIDDVSDTIDLGGAPAFAQDALNLRAERGSAGFDVRHRFSASFIADLPAPKRKRGAAASLLGGWQLSSVLNARTGHPFTLAVPFDANQDGILTDRPSSARGLAFYDEHGPKRVEMEPGRTAVDFFVPGQNGLVGRNTARGDGLIDWDLAVNRKIHFADARSFELRVEVFNVLNRANFGLPVRTIGDPGFGSSTNTVTPARIIQVALKLGF